MKTLLHKHNWVYKMYQKESGKVYKSYRYCTTCGVWQERRKNFFGFFPWKKCRKPIAHQEN